MGIGEDNKRRNTKSGDPLLATSNREENRRHFLSRRRWRHCLNILPLLRGLLLYALEASFKVVHIFHRISREVSRQLGKLIPQCERVHQQSAVYLVIKRVRI